MAKKRGEPSDAQLSALINPDEQVNLVPEVRGLTRYGPTVLGSLHPDTPAIKDLLWKVTTGQSVPKAEWIGKPWPTVNIVVCIREGEIDGEVGPFIALCLIGPDDRFIVTGSNIIIGQLSHLMRGEWYGPPPWQPPLNLIIKENRSRSGQTYYTVEVSSKSPAT
jgi:hypothetical protein